jgi:hypothetical protein
MKNRQPGWGNIPWMALWDAMKSCPQTEGQSVWEHGESVVLHLEELISYLKGEKTLDDWRLPEWLSEFREQILSSLPDHGTIRAYAMYHDCGKPFCRVIGEDGKQHFPDHAKVSRAKYLEVTADAESTDSCSYEIADLIAHDMDIHLMKADDVEAFCNLRYPAALLLTGLAEIHSNAKMFGGIESTSFKIKFKQIEKRGKQVCQRIFNTVNK